MRVGKRVEVAVRGEVDGEAVAAAHVTDVPLERRLEAEIVQHARRRPSDEVPHRPHDVVDQLTAFRDRGRDLGGDRAAHPIDAAQLHSQRGQHLADMVVQLPREVLPLLLLHRDELLRELTQLAFRFLRQQPLLHRAALDDAEADDGGQRDQHAEQQALPQQRAEPALKAGEPAGDLGALGREIGVVELLDVLRDRQRRLAPRQHLAAQEAEALRRPFRPRSSRTAVRRPPSSLRASPAGCRCARALPRRSPASAVPSARPCCRGGTATAAGGTRRHARSRHRAGSRG